MHKQRTSIPWAHTSSAIISLWVWETPHFVVTISREGMSVKKMFNWKIVDKSTGVSQNFESGPDVSFESAVDTALEIIAKAYPRELGYQQYAGELATTFTVANGRRYNFASAIGENVIVRALDENNEEQLYTGLFDTQNYSFIVSSGNKDVTMIPPGRVLDVVKEFGMSSFLQTSPTVNKKMSRTVNAEWVPGCTGQPGYRANTVTHSSNTKFCPIHQV